MSTACHSPLTNAASQGVGLYNDFPLILPRRRTRGRLISDRAIIIDRTKLGNLKRKKATRGIVQCENKPLNVSKLLSLELVIQSCLYCYLQ